MARLRSAPMQASRLDRRGLELSMWHRHFKPGDLVVFRRIKHTTHPGRRAQDVEAAPHGDLYNYFVEKSWIVESVHADGGLLLKTRRGKTHIVDPSDPNLRHATLWDRIRYRKRFAELRTGDRAS